LIDATVSKLKFEFENGDELFGSVLETARGGSIVVDLAHRQRFAERMSGTSYSSPDEVISAISELIASLPKDQRVGVYKNWMKHLNWVNKHREEYYRK
jgi:hypothetical protein